MCDSIISNNNKISNYNAFPYDIIDVDPIVTQDLLRNFTGERTGFVQVGPRKYFFPSGYRREAQYYYNFQSRPDDVWVVTFPRSGTTWTQEMVWLLANDLNYEKAAEISLLERFPFLEFGAFVHPDVKKEFLMENNYDGQKLQMVHDICTPGYEVLNNIQERRFIKTHLPFSLLPPNLLEIGCKVIYVARNPKDVAVSFYHLNRLFRTQGYSGEFPQYWNYFERNLQPWTPYWAHIEEAWQRRNDKNLLFLYYEDINENLINGIENVANFLGKTYTQCELDKLAQHLQIDNFRHNKSVNLDILKDVGIILANESGFVRRGKNGGWRDSIGDDLNRRIDNWFEENLNNVELKMPTSWHY